MLYNYCVIKIVEFILYFIAISTIFVTHKFEDYVFPYILYLYSIFFYIEILKKNNRINHKLYLCIYLLMNIWPYALIYMNIQCIN